MLVKVPPLSWWNWSTQNIHACNELRMFSRASQQPIRRKAELKTYSYNRLLYLSSIMVSLFFSFSGKEVNGNIVYSKLLENIWHAEQLILHEYGIICLNTNKLLAAIATWFSCTCPAKSHSYCKKESQIGKWYCTVESESRVFNTKT